MITFTIELPTVAVTGVTLSPSTAQTIDVDGKVSFTAAVAPDNATDKTVKWSVGGTNAGAVKLYTDKACTAEVGADATETLTVYAKGIAAGSATVTATSNADSEKKASCDVTVNAAAGTISYATASVSKTVGDADFTNELTNTGDGLLTYASHNDDVATVDSDTGEVHIVGEGDTTIQATVTDGNNYTYATKTAQYTLTVNAATHSVTVTPGSNMTKTANSGAASQTGLSGAMADVVYTADDGYYFPDNYSVAAVNGISVTRNSYTQITVSGTPTADAEITLTAPTAKTTPDAPTTAAATDCTTADNNDGKLTGVTTAMEYKKSDAQSWTAGTGSDITGLVPGTYYVRVKATDTTNESDNQELTINAAQTQTETLLTTVTPTGQSTYSQTPEGVVTVTLDNLRAYYSEYGWCWKNGSVTVAANEGYTITKCVFRQNDKDPITISASPFALHWEDFQLKEDRFSLMDDSGV